MLILIGKYRAWKTIDVDGSSIRVLLEAMDDRVRQEVLADIDHLKGVDSENKESATEAWYEQLLVRYGQHAIKNWKGVGASDEEGNLTDIAVSPENIEALMKFRDVGTKILSAINEMNSRVVEETVDAGNVSGVASSGTDAAALTH